MATVRKFKGNWVADYRDQWGKRHREKPDGTFENKALQQKAAQTLLARRLGEVERSAFVPANAKPTFSEVCAEYLTSKVNIRSTTRRSYSSIVELYLIPYFGDRKIHQIATADIERFRNALSNCLPAPIAEAFVARQLNARPGLTAARAKQRMGRLKPGIRTINKALTLLVMVFNYAAKHRWVDYNPAEFVEKIRPPVDENGQSTDLNILTPDEVRLLLEAADEPRRGQDGVMISNNYRLLLKCAVFTGMRQGEILGLQWGDIDWNSQQLHVRRAWKEGAFHQPKTTNSLRRIDLPSTLLVELREWRLACPRGKHDLVFPNLQGNPMSHANLLQRGFCPALRRAGLRKIRFHDLRHTFASLLIANGEDVVRVSRLLGHASPTITLNVYSHMLPKEHYGSADRLADIVLETSRTKNNTSRY